MVTSMVYTSSIAASIASQLASSFRRSASSRRRRISDAASAMPLRYAVYETPSSSGDGKGSPAAILVVPLTMLIVIAASAYSFCASST